MFLKTVLQKIKGVISFRKVFAIWMAVFILSGSIVTAGTGSVAAAGTGSVATEGKSKIIDNDPHSTGLKPPTKDDIAWMDKNMLKTKHVKLNSLGLDRVNKEREKNNLKKIDKEKAVRTGEETTSNVGVDVDSLTPESIPPIVDNSGIITLTDPNNNNATYTNQFFPPIRSQGGQGSCAAFSTTYYQFSHMIALDRNWSENNSDNEIKFSPKWTYNMLNNGTNGGVWPSDVYQLLNDNGCATWGDVPYNEGIITSTDYREWGNNGTLWSGSTWRNALNYRLDTCGTIEWTGSNDLSQIKGSLTDGNVLVGLTFAYSWVYDVVGNNPDTTLDDAFTGQHAIIADNGTDGGHAITIVGYNDDIWIDINHNSNVDEGEKGALKIANSWGSFWGNSGFSWIAYDALNKETSVTNGYTSTNRRRMFSYLSDNNQAFYITVKDSSYTPKLTAEFTINHPARSDLKVSLGVSDPNQNTCQDIWYPKALNLNGGSFNFNGLSDVNGAEGTFVLDYTELILSNNITAEDIKQKKWYLGITDSPVSASVAHIYSFKLTDENNEIVTQNLDYIIDSTTQYFGLSYPSPTPTNTPSPTPLSDPSISFPIITTSSITVAWTAINGATGYKVYNNSDVLLLTTSDTSHTFTGFASGTKYYYKVKAYYGTQLSPGNNLTSAYTMLDTPAPSISGNTNNTVTIAWPAVARANKYLVQLDSNTIIDTNSNALNYTFTGINPGEFHTYKVQALMRNVQGVVFTSSDWGETTFTIPTPTPTPTPIPAFNINTIPNNTFKFGDDFFDANSNAMLDPNLEIVTASLLKDGPNKNKGLFKFGGLWYDIFELTDEQLLDPLYAMTEEQVNALTGFNKWYKVGSEVVQLPTPTPVP